MIRENFPLESLDKDNSWKFLPLKKTRYTVYSVEWMHSEQQAKSKG